MNNGRAYYNEIDPYCAHWLRNLIAAGHIAPGDVDERSIEDVRPDDVRGYKQCHFFAGIGGWALAFSYAGFMDEAWTGSPPCQPFSSAGKGRAEEDSRHLWPELYRLVRKRRPPIVFGEQVETAIGYGWIDRVHSDLESENYAFAAAVLPAACAGAPQIGNRVYFVAKAAGERNGIGERLSTAPRRESSPDAYGTGWSSFVPYIAKDRNRRRIEPGLIPVAYGVPAPMEQLRAYGNAIVPQVAATFIRASM